jgi:hypothetical protein
MRFSCASFQSFSPQKIIGCGVSTVYLKKALTDSLLLARCITSCMFCMKVVYITTCLWWHLHISLFGVEIKT